MRTEPEKRRPVTPLAELVTDFMEMLRERLDLSCVALGPGCRDMEADLALTCSRIDEIDFFGVGAAVDSRKLNDVVGRLPAEFQGRGLKLAAVNGPYRTAYPGGPTLVFHLTIWPQKWLARVCPFVVNGFRTAQVFVGTRPGSLVPQRQPAPRQLLDWHYGLENCLQYIRTGAFEGPTWWIDGAPRDGKMVRHDISDPYRMCEFIAYTLNAALCNAEHFPSLNLPPSAQSARFLAAEFRRRAVDARNGDPVDSAWLSEQRQVAEALIDRLIRELKEVL